MAHNKIAAPMPNIIPIICPTMMLSVIPQTLRKNITIMNLPLMPKNSDGLSKLLYTLLLMSAECHYRLYDTEYEEYRQQSQTHRCDGVLALSLSLPSLDCSRYEHYSCCYA